MKSNPFDGITRPSLPTLSDIERRMAELTGVHQKLDATGTATDPPGASHTATAQCAPDS